MFPAAPFVVIVDANVLYPFVLRDTLLRAAHAGFFQLRWSREILDEMDRSLVATGRLSNEQAHRLRSHMERVFPDAKVDDYDGLISAMQNHEKDRHVAAAAVKAGAQVIVTLNLKDFEKTPSNIEPQAPDAFLCNLFDLDPEAFVELLREQAADLTRPVVSFPELLAQLARIVPDFAAAVHEYLGDVNARTQL